MSSPSDFISSIFFQLSYFLIHFPFIANVFLHLSLLIYFLFLFLSNKSNLPEFYDLLYFLLYFLLKQKFFFNFFFQNILFSMPTFCLTFSFQAHLLHYIVLFTTHCLHITIHSSYLSQFVPLSISLSAPFTSLLIITYLVLSVYFSLFFSSISNVLSFHEVITLFFFTN